ncbi:MAG: hypothetical protein A2Z91_03215 [Deltaproteobacteria bacterium GWA2_38_16]|nr:MAG: hypothetical protein A2Z91_03215 [Deltaproteobacteria bacterium GWA2_38_16]OGQ02895.1 MAG: hypothetical protein A3D19_06645 [Deltaproteobacteria bacterium RIFCSPHIGHO2_02_FULL_38_15]OGQ35090.1 MAG: hypothetical protein A3A72_03535 [Deltaproteobacteria bacterium RIFCSPLOWO2_01_FULL_38_9]OGQ63427.1 MAG: hypothetical protein A3G92_07040 [Deltaproteobacteria bacterium RIFCSPLOWO2_12_FULL_38_8]HBQ21742.1 hypothetical protein [Deltaproteobacteria bacterium]
MKKLGLLIIVLAFLVPGASFATAPEKKPLPEITGSGNGDCGSRSVQAENNEKAAAELARKKATPAEHGSHGEDQSPATK